MSQPRQSLQQQISYQQAIVNPQTTEDLILALQDPRSPAYRAALNMLMEGIALDVIRERLMDRFVEKKFLEEQIERNALLEEKEVRYDREDKFMREELRLQQKQAEKLHVPVDSDVSRSLDKIQKDSAAILDQITELKQKSKEISAELSNLRKERQQLSQEWYELQDENAAETTRQINDGELIIYDVTGEPMSDAERARAVQVIHDAERVPSIPDYEKKGVVIENGDTYNQLMSVLKSLRSANGLTNGSASNIIGFGKLNPALQDRFVMEQEGNGSVIERTMQNKSAQNVKEKASNQIKCEIVELKDQLKNNTKEAEKLMNKFSASKSPE